MDVPGHFQRLELLLAGSEATMAACSKPDIHFCSSECCPDMHGNFKQCSSISSSPSCDHLDAVGNGLEDFIKGLPDGLGLAWQVYDQAAASHACTGSAAGNRQTQYWHAPLHGMHHMRRAGGQSNM